MAISFISPEDLERIHAPNGFLREVEPGYLHDQMESRMHHVVDALDALEGRFLNRQASACFAPSSIEKRDPSNAAVWVDGANEATKTQPISFNKRSSIWNLFRRTRPEPQPEPSKSAESRQALLRLTFQTLKDAPRSIEQSGEIPLPIEH